MHLLQGFDGEVAVADIVLEAEIKDPAARAQLSSVARIYEFTGVQVSEAYEVRQEMPSLSLEDSFSFVAARALGSMLLTGDAKLRQYAERYDVEVHGTLWLLDYAIEHRFISPVEAWASLALMLRAGSRFPADEVETRRRIWGGR